MTDWVRLWHDMPTDPKWRVIARKSGQPLPCVLSVFVLMMANASGNASERGHLSAWDHEDAAAALDMDEEAVQAIYEAMQGKVLEGTYLTGWEKRQPKREDSTAFKRKAEWKERKKNASERSGTQGNAPDADSDADISDADASGAEAPVDLAKALFDSAVPYLVTHGSKEKNARSMVASWRKTHGDGPVIDAVAAAQRNAVSEPIPFIIKYLERKDGQQTRGLQRNAPPPANPLLAAAIRRYGNRDSPDGGLDFGASVAPTGGH